jgi:hypothetical protein
MADSGHVLEYHLLESTVSDDGQNFMVDVSYQSERSDDVDGFAEILLFRDCDQV